MEVVAGYGRTNEKAVDEERPGQIKPALVGGGRLLGKSVGILDIQELALNYSARLDSLNYAVMCDNCCLLLPDFVTSSLECLM